MSTRIHENPNRRSFAVSVGRCSAVFYKGIPLNCVEAAKKTQKTLNQLQWGYFHCIDLLAYLGCCFKQKQFSIVRGLTSEMIFEQKPQPPSRQRISAWVTDHFKTIDKNVEYLDQAEVICLGEEHDNMNHRLINAEVIHALSKKGDLILTEDNGQSPCPSLWETTEQVRFVEDPLEIQGWDLPLIRHSIKNVVLASIALAFPKVYTLSYLKDRSYNATQQLLNKFPERHHHMCKKIEENWKGDRKIYVIGGFLHFCSPKENSRLAEYFDLKPVDRAYEETLQYLRTKKFAILIPKKLNYDCST